MSEPDATTREINEKRGRKRIVSVCVYFMRARKELKGIYKVLERWDGYYRSTPNARHQCLYLGYQFCIPTLANDDVSMSHLHLNTDARQYFFERVRQHRWTF
jgi:hypothetical protein